MNELQPSQSRPFEFRAWHVPTGRMYYRITFTEDYVYRPWCNSKTDSENYRIVDKPLDRGECILMQFTGCYDKYGAKVWEGDILRWDHVPPTNCMRDERPHSTYYHVRFINGGFCTVHLNGESFTDDDPFYFSDGGTPTCDTKAGNEYEHPHLLALTGEQPLALVQPLTSTQSQETPAQPIAL